MRSPRRWSVRALQHRFTRRRLVAAVAVVALLTAVITWLAWPEGVGVRVVDAMVTVSSGPDRDELVQLDTTLYLPDVPSPAPAVLLAHGFGGDKDSLVKQAEALADRGYVVLAYSARGFGRSGGTISLDSPDYEVNDARGLLDLLARRPEVRLDGPGDPRVGVVGGSYGGALALLLAAQDRRVDAIVPSITWNDLAGALFPEATGAGPEQGVFKQQWAGLFFGTGTGSGTVGTGTGTGTGTGPVGAGTPLVDPQCGRFSRDVCTAYLASAAAGRPTAETIALLRRSSPAGVLDRITAPTMLVQGQYDTLFPLAEADENARGIAATGAPVKVVWYAGGHDDPGSSMEQARVRGLTAAWLNRYLRDGPDQGTGFSYTVAGGLSLQNGRPLTVSYRTDRYPGVTGSGRNGVETADVALTGGLQAIANPAGGSPAAVSSLPGLGTLGVTSGQLLVDVPGQAAFATSEPLADPRSIVGAPTIRLRVGSPTGEAVLFVKLYDLGPDGRPTLPGGAVAPIRLTGLPRDAADAPSVEVSLPVIAHKVAAGHRLQVVVSCTDAGYAGPGQPVVHQVAVDGPLVLPSVDAQPARRSTAMWWWAVAAVGVTVGLGALVATLVARRRRTHPVVSADLAAVPLLARSLRKEYAGGSLAVADASFTVQPGQVLGLLGPNGAGKTTILRMLLGLIRPSDGELIVYGRRVTPGAPVLARLGSLVEGTGFLPHLSGLDNLRMYWRATGRPADRSRLDEVLRIAGLGDAVRRPVKAYSQGMRQRLAIAQAMLGMPDLLVLDEPTNGLDPPQIHAMRQVLRGYAVDGRSVLVSSHLLAEVEQTCTHVVVMDRGKVIAAGPVSEIVGTQQRSLEDVFLALVGDVAEEAK